MILTIDTETADLSGNVYDVAAIVHNKRGEIVAEYTALVSETMTNPAKMMGAFYAKKIFTHYIPMIDAGSIRVRPWADITASIQALVLQHNVKTIAAYNLGFDMRVLKQTGNAYGARILPHGNFKLLDIWQFACEVRLSRRTYKNLATSMGWVSDHGNLRTGAEYAYRFCSGDHGFIEDHTALSDARIEVAILAECFKQKKPIPYGKVNQSPWKLVNK
jgi:DNA polymerase III epsilon subunit-like protein